MAQHRTPARDLALIAVFAGITAALGLIPAFYTPFSPAPITAQSFGIILAGAVIGGRRALLSQLLFIALVALGLPLLAGGRGGIGVFASPTVGFLVGYVVCAGVIGWFTFRKGAPYSIAWGLLINVLGGMVLMYAFGIIGMMAVAKLSFPAAILANLPYLPGDTIKVVAATLIARGVHAAYPGLLPWRGTKVEDAPSEKVEA
ncbi:biotin transport system substrate-specific component [Raineyella antarctica]|uniref:Biotin transporter n=1 Tax=Raineyella antarctica TaxID=1577474 RepID=A0A1G6HHQ1_9ACTN|nr:biotin transporter BioY [Raineyella antarctica]SDB93779.1 biotin transport system substrate-specific component [Raineyella antarctica]